MDTLKKAGLMLAHLELFHQMRDLRALLHLAAHMEERGDRVTLISPEQITLVGAQLEAAPELTTGKGATVQAATAYAVLHGLKGHDAPEYAVTREELGALNARAVAELEASDALRAFEQTLTRLQGADSRAPGSDAPTGPERPGRTRRTEPEPSPDAPTPSAA